MSKEKKHFIEHIENYKPYWGRFLMAAPSPAERFPFLAELIKLLSEKNKFLRILEIGSYAGASAVTIASSIKKYNNGNGKIICIDPWCFSPAVNLQKNTFFDTNDIDIASYTYEDMFHHNIKASKCDDLIQPIKGFSGDILPILKENYFDLIYIDGDHSYDGFLNDLKLSHSLLKEGGFICGDDLDIAFPGILQAIFKFFDKNVSDYLGFWCQKKSATNWLDINNLSGQENWILDLINKDSYIESAIRDFNKILETNQWTKIIIYGGGKHTKRLFTQFDLNNVINADVVGIIDDNQSITEVAGIPVEHSFDIDADVVLISSDNYEEKLIKLMLNKKKNIPVYGLYSQILINE